MLFISGFCFPLSAEYDWLQGSKHLCFYLLLRIYQKLQISVIYVKLVETK